MQTMAVKVADEATAEAGEEDAAQATPAELPDHAYIRTQATGAPSSSCPPMSLVRQLACLVRRAGLPHTPCTVPSMFQPGCMQEHDVAEQLLIA